MDFSDLCMEPGESKTFFLPCVSKIVKMETVMIDYVGHCQFRELCIIYNVSD